MTKQAKKTKRIVGLTSLAMLVVMVITVIASSLGMHASGNYSGINPFKGELNTNKEHYYNSSVMQQLPSTVKDSDELSIIVKLDTAPLLDIYKKQGITDMTFGEYTKTEEANAYVAEMLAEKSAILASFDAVGLSYTTGADYASVLSGFEVGIVAKDFKQLCTTLGTRGTAIVGEVYEIDKTELVENPVDVKDSGIFDSTDFAYDGTGMVVAVLDTGLDYYHTAFSLDYFTADRSKLGLTYEQVAALLGDTKASGIVAGLTANDVYINEKVPYSFDYADYDADVFPINSDHGTHVAGIIAGHDDEIRGVAPNAQLVIMKTFSDVESTARTSWILSALEDCVVLGVDVINMSLGTGCGFSRESDKEQISGVYERIREQGIAVVAAASNSYNSTYGSEKNGNLGLTSNPDSATVSSPGTYKGALSVASIQGVKTPYILFGDTIIYYTESSDRVSEEKIFFDDLNLGETEVRQLEYVTVPGVGRSADYAGLDVTGKIVLVRRGSNTFEEKANVAQEKGAAGIIVYNNVSGDIKMNVGDTVIAVCSISQDDGEMLAEAASGVLTISRSQTSGPFMSDFSSWGPAPDLSIKPEITAHGGSIYSSVPGQSYDRISGTSMACPNLAGVVALLRQYVMENYGLQNDPNGATAMVNQLLMSSADIILNVNGLPYSVRKQGAGLANLDAAASTTALILTYDKNGNAMSTSKLELGDDKAKTGVYTMTFAVKNFGKTALTYNIGAYVMTEGVSETLTSHGETTVTEDGYMLDGATIAVNGSTTNTQITVGAGQTQNVTVTITLSDADKKYLNDSFANGMYVEGFITLDAADESIVDLNVPYLGFYGDWTQAPLFDLDYYQTNADELDDGIDPEDKVMADACATRPIGGLSDDYVNYLGSYYYVQNPNAKVIAANKDFIALSNQEGAVHSLRFVWAGMLRNAERIEITITDDATGEVIFETVEYDVRKSYGDGGSIYPANVDIEFDVAEHNLKNNATYTVRLEGFIDYGDGGVETNKNNVFEFPLTVDFESPTVTDCEFYTEYDKSAKKNRLYAKIAVYDNHYAMAMQIGYVALELDAATNTYGYVLKNFDKYLTPVYSTFNGVSYVTYELTDYIHEIRNNAANKNTITVACYDYALNEATYEIGLPSEYTDFYFAETETGLTMSPNEVYTLSALTYPGTEWPELLEYSSANSKVATVVNNKLVAIAPGKSRIIAHDPSGQHPDAYFTLTVLAPGDDGYKRYDKPVADSFSVTGFYVDKAYYQLSTDDRKIGVTGDEMKFASPNYLNLTMYPSEAVTLRYKLDAYFPANTTVKFESSNNKIVTVDQTGKITAVAEGYASISVRVYMDGKGTLYSKSITIEVLEPYITTGPSLTHYFGLGGVVSIPNTLAITEIGQFAFSNFDYIAKDPSEITEETPEFTKIWYIGDNTIEEVIIPEGVEKIGPYAFANLTALKKVTLPSTLTTIDYGAFTGCKALRTIEGLEHVKFINQGAFSGCSLAGTLNLDAAVAVADYAFYGNTNLQGLMFSDKIQSIGAYAAADCTVLNNVTIEAEKVKLGKYAFANCISLEEISVNASVVPTGIFSGCVSLKNVTLGKDVNQIGEFAFLGTAVVDFTIAEGNETFKPQTNLPYILNFAGNEIMLVSPTITSLVVNDANITAIGVGALSHNTKIKEVKIPSVTVLNDYAFAYCTSLTDVTLGNLTKIGAYAFYATAITSTPSFDYVTSIGNYAFAESDITSLVIPSGTEDNRFIIGTGAFEECQKLASVTIGDYVTVGKNAFRLENIYNYTTGSEEVNGKKIYFFIYTSPLHSLTIGDHVVLEERAFYGAAEIETITLGDGAVIGDYAFYNNCALKTVTGLDKAVSVGEGAFSGDVMYQYTNAAFQTPVVNADGYYEYRYYASQLTSADLSHATSIGKDAFSFVSTLQQVVLGAGVTEIPDRAFQGCESLVDINLEHVKVLGEEVFVYADFTEVDLSSVTSVGAYAFAYCEALTDVTLNLSGCAVEEGAFSNSKLLDTVTNLDKVTYVGDYAFAYTALASADLTSATYIGTQAFLRETLTPFTVVLGSQLADMGDNPFAMCVVAPFHTEEVVGEFNGVEYTAEVYTFNISDTIHVIDGSLYRVVPNGLELITFAGIDNRMVVADNTVRISAMAFAGSDVKEVVLPYTVYSIGHKAFYACNNLRLVTFTSYSAPVLEEEYDQMRYYSCDYIPASGEYEVVDFDGVSQIKVGLGIVPYYMWNVTSQPASVFYGANFVNYIGEVAQKITMIRPSNGQNYDSFIFAQYFDTFLDGASAADKVTLYAMSLIEALPEKITLKDKAAVVAARAAYSQISTLEQQSLVTGLYSKLTAAEKRISDLEYLNQPTTPDTPDVEEPQKTPLTASQVWNIVLGILAGVMTAAAGTFAILFFMPQIKALLAKRGKQGEAETESVDEAQSQEETQTDDTSDEA